MLKYSIKRLARSLITLVILITLVFALLRFMPEEGYFNNYEKMSPAQIELGLIKMGLKDPLYVQVVRFIGNLLKGDLGLSYRYRVNTPIARIIAPKIAPHMPRPTMKPRAPPMAIPFQSSMADRFSRSTPCRALVPQRRGRRCGSQS